MKSLIIFAALLMASSGVAQALTPEDAFKSLKGHWQGHLSYRDYSQNKWYDLPENKTIEVLADGHTFLETARYDDGPTGIVYIYTLSAFESDSKTIKSFSTRKGRAAVNDQETVSFKGSPASSENFILVFDSEGQDDNRPAHLRTTLTRKGSHYDTLKEVDFTDDNRNEWLVRNTSSLDLIKP